MRERRGEEIKEKQRIYAKNHREKLRKERENAMANEEGLKQAAFNGPVRAVTHSTVSGTSFGTHPCDLPDTVPASAGAPHVSEVGEAMALKKAEEKLNMAEEKRLKKENYREKLKKELKDAMEALKQAASNAEVSSSSYDMYPPPHMT